MGSIDVRARIATNVANIVPLPLKASSLYYVQSGSTRTFAHSLFRASTL